MMQSRVCLFSLFSLGHHTCPEISLILAEAQNPWIRFTKPHLSCYCYAFWFSLYIWNSKRHYSCWSVLYIHLYLPTFILWGFVCLLFICVLYFHPGSFFFCQKYSLSSFFSCRPVGNTFPQFSFASKHFYFTIIFEGYFTRLGF